MSDSVSPPLETGWFPATPVNDTYLRRYLLNWAGFCAASAVAAGGESRDLPEVSLADARGFAPFTNCATLLQPLAPERIDETMEAIAAFYAFDSSCAGDVMLCSAWPTADLRPLGWELMGHPPLHLLPCGATPRPTPTELCIDEVCDLEGLLAWERAAVDGFPIELPTGTPPGSIVHESWLADPRRRMWVGWLDDRPACASSAWTEYGINNVTLVATIPEARRRGYGEALTWRAAQADPALPAMLFSSDDGRPVYDRMGFLPLQRLTLWHRERAGIDGNG
jgi:hypothetical protein